MTGSVKQAFVASAPARNGAAAPKQRGDGRAFGDVFRTPAKEPATARRAESAAPQRSASAAQPAAPIQSTANPPVATASAAASTAPYVFRAGDRMADATQPAAISPATSVTRYAVREDSRAAMTVRPAAAPSVTEPAIAASVSRHAVPADGQAAAVIQSVAAPPATTISMTDDADRAAGPPAMPHSAIIERMRQAFPRELPETAEVDAQAGPIRPRATKGKAAAEPSGQHRNDPIGAVLSDLREKLRSLTNRPLPAQSENVAQNSAAQAMPEGTASSGTASSRPAIRVAVDGPAVPVADPESRAPSGAEHTVSDKSESALSIASNPARPRPSGTGDLPPRRTERTVYPEAVHSQERYPCDRSNHAAEPVSSQVPIEHPPRRNIDIAAVTQPVPPREALRALLTQLERKPTEAEPALPQETAQEKAAPHLETGRHEAPTRPVPTAAMEMRPRRDAETHVARSRPEAAPTAPLARDVATGQHPAAARPASEARTAADARPLWGADVFDIAGIDPDLLRAALALEQSETAAKATAAPAGLSQPLADTIPALPGRTAASEPITQSAETPHAVSAATPPQHRAEVSAHRSSDTAIMPQAGRVTSAGVEHAGHKDTDGPAVFAASEPREPSPAPSETLRAAEQPASPPLPAQAQAAPVPTQSIAPAAASRDERATVVGRGSMPGVPDRQGARETAYAGSAAPVTTGRTQPHVETPQPAAPPLRPAIPDVRPAGASNKAGKPPVPTADGMPRPIKSGMTAPLASSEPLSRDGAPQAATPDTARSEMLRSPAAPAAATTIGQPANMPAAAEATTPDRIPARADRPAPGDDFEPLAASARPAAADARFVAGVSVETAQSIPAPATAGAPVPIADLATVLSADSAWKSMAGTHAGFQTLGGHSHLRHASTLRIELKPVELGAVTAELKLVGDQLSVAISVDTQEAYQRLTQDHDSIVQSLRSLGLQVDQVSIQQPQIASRADQGNTSFNAGPRDPGSSGSGQPGDGQGQQGTRSQSGASRDESYNPASQARRGADAGGGLYI